jgi:hypothetical protein
MYHLRIRNAPCDIRSTGKLSSGGCKSEIFGILSMRLIPWFETKYNDVQWGKRYPKIHPAGTKNARRNLKYASLSDCFVQNTMKRYMDNTATDRWNPDQHAMLGSIWSVFVWLSHIRMLERVWTMDIIIVFAMNDKDARKKEDVMSESLSLLSQQVLVFCYRT